jgi:RimJ/RimL family protein N-acetyltransferase
MITILETERLVLRQFTMDDATFIIELVNTPGWIEFIGDRNIKATEQAKNYLQNGLLKSYELNGFHAMARVSRAITIVYLHDEQGSVAIQA